MIPPPVNASSPTSPPTVTPAWRCSKTGSSPRRSARPASCWRRCWARTSNPATGVDPDARHGHKTQARGFDGYKGHVAVDPDSEIITATTVTPGNAGDASVAEDLIDDLVDDGPRGAKVYGDSAYGTGEFQQHLNDHGIESGCRSQPPAPRPGGLFTKGDFTIDLDHDTVTCPAGETVDIERGARGDGIARFAGACGPCPLRASCTTSPAGRTITVGRHEAALAEARAQQ